MNSAFLIYCNFIIQEVVTISNLTYALHEGKLIYVDNVKNGLKCNCFCPACGDKLVARNKGEVKSHHFAHYFGAECSGAVQTALHLLAKDIILKEKNILLPEYDTFNYRIVDQKVYQCETVYLEKKIGSFVPDVIINTLDRKKILVEIKVTHGIDEFKLDKIKTANISTVEIDLSTTNLDITEENLRKAILEESKLKNWVYHKEGNELNLKIYENSIIKPIINKKLGYFVDNCPIKEQLSSDELYADVIDDCSRCKFFIEQLFDEKNKEDSSIRCFGHLKIDEYKNIKLPNSKSDNAVMMIKNIQEKKLKLKNKNSREFSKNETNILSYEIPKLDLRERISQNKTLIEIWYANDEKPFLAVNKNGIQVMIFRNPAYQYLDEKKIEGIVFSRDGHNLGKRTIFGARKKDWKFSKSI